MALSLRKSLQEIFVVTDGYSASRVMDRGIEYEPVWSQELIHSIKHDRFIELCAGYFEEKGYRTKINAQHDKKLIDIWLFKESYSGTKPFGIVKCWETKAIDVETSDLSEILKIKMKNQIPLGLFITAGKFSENITINKDKEIKLVDGERLFKMVTSLPEIRSQRLLDKVTQNI